MQSKEDKGNIPISFESKDGYIRAIIEDDGIEQEKAASRKHEVVPHKSLAIKISQERLEKLRKHQTTPAGITIEDPRNEQCLGCGTKVNYLYSCRIN